MLPNATGLCISYMSYCSPTISERYKKVLSRQNVDCIAVSQSCGSSLESVEPTHMQTIYTNCVVVVITMTNGVYINNISGV